ncbi:hypothetical protein [Vibrio phage vB_VpaP_AL-1]|nr:hypothetical protein [Vibrio phage vB_VpaP_AL-1]
MSGNLSRCALLASDIVLRAGASHLPVMALLFKNMLDNETLGSVA